MYNIALQISRYTATRFRNHDGDGEPAVGSTLYGVLADSVFEAIGAAQKTVDYGAGRKWSKIKPNGFAALQTSVAATTPPAPALFYTTIAGLPYFCQAR